MFVDMGAGGERKGDVRGGDRAKGDQDIIIKAAAVADYRPQTASAEKIKKADDMSIALERTDDILGWLGSRQRPGSFCVASMETQNMLRTPRQSLRKHVDMIVANNLKVAGAGSARTPTS